MQLTFDTVAAKTALVEHSAKSSGNKAPIEAHPFELLKDLALELYPQLHVPVNPLARVWAQPRWLQSQPKVRILQNDRASGVCCVGVFEPRILRVVFVFIHIVVFPVIAVVSRRV